MDVDQNFEVIHRNLIYIPNKKYIVGVVVEYYYITLKYTIRENYKVRFSDYHLSQQTLLRLGTPSCIGNIYFREYTMQKRWP